MVAEDRRRKLAGYYCVNCGKDEPRGLEKCPGSECGLTHLLARYGHVESWFKVQKVARGS